MTIHKGNRCTDISCEGCPYDNICIEQLEGVFEQYREESDKFNRRIKDIIAAMKEEKEGEIK
jgi:hypothetical protein